MPAGRPRNPTGTGESAPVLTVRLDAETEAALGIIGRGAVRAAIRAFAREQAGPQHYQAAVDRVTRARLRKAA